MAGVVAVLISILAMASGAEKVVAKTGSDDRAIVLAGGAISELLSNLSRAETIAVQDAPGVAKDQDGKPIVSAETVVLVEMKQQVGSPSNVTLRGASTQLFKLRPEIKVIEGRPFQPGTHELIVGKAARAIFSGLGVGSTTQINGQAWMVVGVFESNGDSRESELLADNETVLSAFRRESFQSVSVRLKSGDDFAAFRSSLTSNPQLAVSVTREANYYAEQSKPFANTLSVIAYLVGGIMAVGAFFGAINSMYTAVSTRTVEIATLRAIGFRSGPIVVSIFIESLLLALAGAAVGAALAALLYGGNMVNANGGGIGHAQYLISMTVTSGQVLLGVIWACFIGIVGALFPAIHAVRMSVVSGLRGT